MAPTRSTDEVAKVFNRSRATICEWVRRGWIRPIQGTGGRGQYQFTDEEIERRKQQRMPIAAY